MRRLLAFAAFFLAISVVPVCAQRGGGHAAGGSRGSMGGGHSVGGSFGSIGGGHAGFSGQSGFVAHSSGAMGSHLGPGMASHSGSHSMSRSGSHYGSGTRYYGHGGHFRNGRYGYRNRCIGCYGWGYPYYSYLPGIDPYWWWDTYPSDDAEQRQIANEMNQQNLEEQQALREQDQDLYAQQTPRYRQPQPSASQQADNDPPTILIFRDQHTREVQNYAIVDEMVWIFAKQRIEKIPLAVLDVPATVQANQNRGVDFRLPGVSEGQ